MRENDQRGENVGRDGEVDRELDCDIYVTGSNAKLLSGDLATYLGGRYVEFVIYPFSFSEFSALYHEFYPDMAPAQCFQKYLTAGGMPYLGNLRYNECPPRRLPGWAFVILVYGVYIT